MSRRCVSRSPPAPRPPPRGDHVRCGARNAARAPRDVTPPSTPPPPATPRPAGTGARDHPAPTPPLPSPAPTRPRLRNGRPAGPAPGCPSPTDSEVKRNVPSSMNTSWKPFSCPFMAEGRRTRAERSAESDDARRGSGELRAAPAASLLFIPSSPRPLAAPGQWRAPSAPRRNHAGRVGGGERYVTPGAPRAAAGISRAARSAGRAER